MKARSLLEELLDQGYDAFAQLRKPRTFEASPLRDPARLLKQLTSKPLRLLQIEDVEEYASAALSTVGTISDYQYFLPRILELSTQSSIIEPEVIALKLKTGNWRTWPSNQQNIIEKIFMAACCAAFRQHPGNYLAESWLVGIAILDIDFSHTLSDLAKSNSGDCALQLAHLVLSELPFASEPFERGFWMEVPESTIQVVRSWLLGQEMRNLLLDMRLAVRSDDVWLLERALARQEGLRPRRLH